MCHSARFRELLKKLPTTKKHQLSMTRTCRHSQHASPNPVHIHAAIHCKIIIFFIPSLLRRYCWFRNSACSCHTQIHCYTRAVINESREIDILIRTIVPGRNAHGYILTVYCLLFTADSLIMFSSASFPRCMTSQVPVRTLEWKSFTR